VPLPTVTDEHDPPSVFTPVDVPNGAAVPQAMPPGVVLCYQPSLFDYVVEAHATEVPAEYSLDRTVRVSDDVVVVERFADEGVVTVEMEAATLFAVSDYLRPDSREVLPWEDRDLRAFVEPTLWAVAAAVSCASGEGARGSREAVGRRGAGGGRAPTPAASPITRRTDVDIMKEDLMDILCCPLDKEELELAVEERDEEEIVTGRLTCTDCGETYPIEDGIPNLLPPDMRDEEAAA
jgi:uncharacterized protein YbaR (Trm112 family)